MEIQSCHALGILLFTVPVLSAVLYQLWYAQSPRPDREPPRAGRLSGFAPTCSVGPSLRNWTDDGHQTPRLFRRTPQVRIPLPGSTVKSGEFSRWQCIGGLEDMSQTTDRACVFSNICYHSPAKEFVFFRRQVDEALAPVLYDRKKGRQWKFRQRVAEGDAVDSDFLHLGGRRIPWSPRVESGPLPSTSRNFSGLTALSAPSIGRFNLGHVAYEEGLPLLVAMAQLGVYSPHLRILRTASCDIQHTTAPPWMSQKEAVEVCKKFEDAFLKPLTGERDAKLMTLDEMAAAGSEWLCFEQLLVGGSFTVFLNEDKNRGKEPLLHEFRHRVLAWHGVNPVATPKTHQILLVEKRGRRGIVNFEEVSSYTAERFKSVAHVCRSNLGQLTLADQFQLLSQTTIAVSPCGGISMILPFLPEGAYVILMNYMRWFSIMDLIKQRPEEHGECHGCSWTMEGELWRHVRHVNKMYYQVWGSADFDKGQAGRDSAVRVDTDRLGSLIQSALLEMEPY